MTDDIDQWCKKVVERSGHQIADSHIFCSIFTKNYMEDPRCALELGLSILMNKPIAILAPDDVEIPEGLLKIASAVERFKHPDDIAEASKRLLKRMEIIKP